MTTGALDYTVSLELKETEIQRLLSLSVLVFPGFDPAYLLDRVFRVLRPVAHTARRDGKLVGFKLAYGRGERLLYSWLGGVHPDARGAGVARELMTRQHDWAARQGYSVVETRTRAANRRMIILNLQAGFEIVGYEVDSAGTPVVSQRKVLEGAPSTNG